MSTSTGIVRGEQRARGVEAGRPGPDHGDAKRARTRSRGQDNHGRGADRRADRGVSARRVRRHRGAARARRGRGGCASTSRGRSPTTGRRGCAPTRSTTSPGSHRPTRRASSATCGRPTARWRRPCSPRETAELGARLAGAPGHAPDPGQRDLEAAVGQGAPLPPGRRVRRLARAAEHDDLLDGARRHERGRRARSTTCEGSRHWPRAPVGGQFHAPDDWLAHVEEARPDGAELELVPIEVPAGGAAFHDGWTFHGSPPNERADRERRSIVSHMVSTETRWADGAAPHPVYSKYRRPGRARARRGVLPDPVARGRVPDAVAGRLVRSCCRLAAGLDDPVLPTTRRWSRRESASGSSRSRSRPRGCPRAAPRPRRPGRSGRSRRTRRRSGCRS